MKSIGLIPKSFPRDTILFDTYREQMAVGQILEPLISSDQFGNIAPALAESWHVSKDGKVIQFRIRRGVFFSNGEKVTANDAEFSIKRHWVNPSSQSYPLLKKIVSISVSGEHELVIKLSEPQVAILKVLSRDHLGIIPKGWSFKEDSLEPIVGTGPFRLVKIANDWIFRRNEKYRDFGNLPDIDWKLVFSPESLKMLSSITQFPDFAPSISQSEVDYLIKNPRYVPSSFFLEIRPTFSQTLAWWNPKGPMGSDPMARKFKMDMIRQLLSERRKRLGFGQSFGLIPKGVAGHLTEEVHFDETDVKWASELISKNPMNKLITIILPPRLKNEVAGSYEVDCLEKKYGVEFLFKEHPDFTKASLNGVDVIIDRWAGGFNDPEGFLPILNQIVTGPLHSYSKELADKLRIASSELSWSKRAELFRAFDHDLVASNFVVSAWRSTNFTLTKKPLREPHSNLRYTPKIIDLYSK